VEINDMRMMLGYPPRKAQASSVSRPKKDFIVENKLKVLKKNMVRN